MPPCTLGFVGSGDISAVSVLSSHRNTIGSGVQLTALLHNLSCPNPQPGAVNFFWTPQGGSPVPAPDVQSGSNQALVEGANGNNIPVGSYLPATVCWVPTLSQVGQPGPSGYVWGNVQVQGVAFDGGQCPAYTPTDFSAPCSMTSGSLKIYGSTSSIVTFDDEVALSVNGLNPRDGAEATFVHIGFVISNATAHQATWRIGAHSLGTGRQLPKPARFVRGSSRFVEAGVRVGIGKARSRLDRGHFTESPFTGVLGWSLFEQLLDGDLVPTKDVKLEPGDVRQGLLEVALPDAGKTTASCLLNVSYVSADDGKRTGGFLVAVSNGGKIL